jgi:CheY-like chemotaxis protein
VRLTRDPASDLLGSTTHKGPYGWLLDLAMPVTDGEAFRWEQLADYTLCDIPVIVLSAVADCPRTARKLRTAYKKAIHAGRAPPRARARQGSGRPLSARRRAPKFAHTLT